MSFTTHLKCPKCGALRSATERYVFPKRLGVVNLSLEEETALTLLGRIESRSCDQCKLGRVNVRRFFDYLKKVIRRALP